jgi:hypothetical protein
MAQVSFWGDPDLEAELIWNQVTLNDIVLPGLARVRGSLKADIEAKKSKGNDGADYTDNGLVPCDFTIELQMWEAYQWEAYQAILPRLLPRKRGTARPLWSVQHPACQLMGISKVYIHEFPFPEPDDDGIVRVALKVLEYIPAPKPVPPQKKQAVVDPGDERNEWLKEGSNEQRAAYGSGGDGGNDDGITKTPIGDFTRQKAERDAANYPPPKP